MSWALILLLASTSLASISPREFYMNEWIIRTKGGSDEAQLIALQYGFEFKGQVLGFENTYHLVNNNHPTRHKREAEHVTKQLNADERVTWAEQQKAHTRTKRDFINYDDFEETAIEQVQDKSFWSELRRMFNAQPKYNQERFNDELWPDQWYLGSKHTTLNVLPVWDKGITGKGIRVSILDDGIERAHEDLRDNYDPDISYDINGDKKDPTPRYDADETNSHGTKCAGEVSMAANNLKCGVGVAYNAKIGGVRMLDGTVNDRVEGTALSYANDMVDIYSSSWGPTDDGKTVDGPRTLAIEAFNAGISKGRQGKGAIFVWASGNGGKLKDSCACDGYVNSPYTLAVSSVSQSGHFPWYGEMCAGTLTATYSSGGITDRRVVAPNLNSTCMSRHTGTSASAPLAAAIIALALEANPNLTWRDVQHLSVVSANPKPILADSAWIENGVKRLVSPKFGFGLMDGAKMVELAQKWKSLPNYYNCTASYIPGEENKFEQHIAFRIWNQTLNLDCPEVQYIEHVLLTVNIQSDKRGDLEIFLTSPQKTTSQLLFQRRYDLSTEGFKNWTILSVQNWNENSNGDWTIEFKCGETCKHATTGEITLSVFGTRESPFYLLDDYINSAIYQENEIESLADNFLKRNAWLA